MVFAYRGLSYFWSWVTAWAIAFAYVGVAAWEGIAISLSAPMEVRQGGGVPVADAMAFSFKPPIFGKILIGGAMCGILTSWLY